MKSKLEENTTALPTIPGIVYRCLGTVLGVIFIALLWSEGQKLFSSSMAGGNMSDRYVEYLIKLVFVIACLTAISGRFWGIHLVKVTSLWVLALAWAHIPETLYDTYMGLVHNYYPVSFSPRYIVLLLVLCFFSVAHIIEKRRLRGRYVEVGSEKNVSISEEVVMWLGVVLLILGCIFKWLWTIYLDTIPVATLVACTISPGVFLILGWAILHKEEFFASSALSIAAILTVYRPVPVERMLTILIWFLPIFLGILSLLQKRSKMRTRMAAILVPFGLMIYFYFVLVPLPMIRWHDKTTDYRPPDFPNCLRAPANATEIICSASKDILYISFCVIEPYPATETLDFISSNLKQTGWRKLNYYIFAPDCPSSHLKGWLKTMNTSRIVTQVDSWQAFWVNHKDEIIYVSLQYPHIDDHQEELSLLRASIIRYEPVGTYKKALAEYRRKHPTK